MKYRHLVEYGVTVVVPYFDGQHRVYLAVQIGAGACWRKAKRMLRVAIRNSIGMQPPIRYVEALLKMNAQQHGVIEHKAKRQVDLDRLCVELMQQEEEMGTDISESAFSNEMELRYDTMPAWWWWNSAERQQAYENWKRRKLGESARQAQGV